MNHRKLLLSKYYASGYSVFNTSISALSEHWSSLSSQKQHKAQIHRKFPRKQFKQTLSHSKLPKWKTQLKKNSKPEATITTNHLLTQFSNNATFTTSRPAIYVRTNPATKDAEFPKIRPRL
jgi:hypothetical protein